MATPEHSQVWARELPLRGFFMNCASFHSKTTPINVCLTSAFRFLCLGNADYSFTTKPQLSDSPHEKE